MAGRGSEKDGRGEHKKGLVEKKPRFCGRCKKDGSRNPRFYGEGAKDGFENQGRGYGKEQVEKNEVLWKVRKGRVEKNEDMQMGKKDGSRKNPRVFAGTKRTGCDFFFLNTGGSRRRQNNEKKSGRSLTQGGIGKPNHNERKTPSHDRVQSQVGQGTAVHSRVSEETSR